MSSSIEEQIKAIEEEIFNTQKNKATEHHIGKLKAKIARLRNEAEKRKSASGKGQGFAAKKTGDATVGIIGFPSVGKSTLLNQFTAASSKIGAYDFTTLDVIPGMMKYQGADIQLLDLPGIIVGAARGKGRGKEILSAIRNVDLLLLLIDVHKPEELEIIHQELFEAGIRMNQHPPDVVVTKTGQGGITVSTTKPLSQLSETMIKAIASEFVINAHIVIRQDITEEQLIDVFAQNRVYVPALVVITKIDRIAKEQRKQLEHYFRNQGWIVTSISAITGQGLEALQNNIFSHLQLLRIYLKPQGGRPDFNEPLILRKGATVEQVCRRLHRDFKEQFRYAQIWGPSAKHEGQKVGLEHLLEDEDIVSIIVTR